MDFMTIGFVVAAAVAVVEAILLLKRRDTQEAPAATPAAPVAPAAPAAGKPSQELVAAVSAALAEEQGTDITRIRIKSITKL